MVWMWVAFGSSAVAIISVVVNLRLSGLLRRQRTLVQEAEARQGKAEARAEAAEARAREAEKRARDAETKAKEVEAKTRDAEPEDASQRPEAREAGQSRQPEALRNAAEEIVRRLSGRLSSGSPAYERRIL
jgi:hypothetical protein